MEENSVNRAQKLQRILTKMERFGEFNARKFKTALKHTAYWTAVFSVGLAIAGAIMVANDVPVVAYAQSEASTARVIVQILSVIIYFLIVATVGTLSAVMAYILEIVITYPYGTEWNYIGSDSTAGGFVNVSAVITGWKMVRDICNIFFSLILVIIALATVLKIESYSWKQLLPKFILMAILINFSKSIAGIFTDLSTVAMATFGGSFATSFGRGFLGAFGLPVLVDFSGTNIEAQLTNNSSLPGVMLAYLAAGLMMILFFALITLFTLVLIFRIVMLWFLIVISPIAYVTRILPQTQKYSSQWWEMFGRWCVIGPMITFFLWLSLSVAFGTEVEQGYNGSPLGSVFEYASEQGYRSNTGAAPPDTGPFEAATPNVLSNFMILAMLLMGSLKLTFDMASEIGGQLGQAFGAVMDFGGKAMGKGGQLFGSTSKYFADKLGGFSDRLADTENDSFAKAAGKTALQGLTMPLNALANLGVLASGTIMQPQAWGKRFAANYAASSKDKQKDFRQKLTNHMEDARGKKVYGHGKGVLAGLRALGANAMGIGAGYGMDDGKEVWDKRNPLSINTWKDAGAKAKNVLGDVMGNTFGDAAGFGNLYRTNKAEKGLQQTNDYKKMASYHNAMEDGVDFEMDLSVEPIRLAVEQQRDALLSAAKTAKKAGDPAAATLETKAKDLTEKLKNQEKIKRDDYLNDFHVDTDPTGKAKMGGELAAGIAAGLQAFEKSPFYNTADKAAIFDTATNKYILDKDGNNDKISGYLDRLDKQQKHFSAKAGAAEAGESFENSRLIAEKVGKELEKIKHVESGDQLQALLIEALEKKKQYQIQAVMSQMVATGNHSRIAQIAGMQADGTITASTGMDGMDKFFKEHLAPKIGNDQATRMMDTILGAAAKKDGAYIGGYSYDKLRGRRRNTPAVQENVQKFVASILTPADIAKMNFSIQMPDGKTKLNNFALHAMAGNAKAFGADPRYFNMMSKANRKALQDNEITLTEIMKDQKMLPGEIKKFFDELKARL